MNKHRALSHSLNISLTALLFLLQAACSTPQYNPEREAEHRMTRAKDALTRNDSSNFVDALQAILVEPAREPIVKSTFGMSPVAIALVQREITTRIDNFRSPAEALATKFTIESFSRVQFLSTQLTSELLTSLSQRVASRNLAKTVPYTFSDVPSNFPILSTVENDYVIYGNTIASLQQPNASSRRDNLIGLMEYAHRYGANSTQFSDVKTVLPSLNIRRDEVSIVRKLFPEYADVRSSELILSTVISFKGADRLVMDDIVGAVKAQISGLNIVEEGKSAALTITIDRIRHDERSNPERQQTITYAQHEVDTMQAVLLMPRNASYIYDVVTGSAEIDYGYSIESTSLKRAKTAKLVRGKVGGSYSRCLNSRIQNVFGGTSSAGFQANDDMRRRCSGPSEVSIEVLRAEVMSKIIESIKEIPEIQVIYELNR